MQLIECVPNFSEGVNDDVIGQIAYAIASVPGSVLLNIDPGRGANRTVITFAGEPAVVVEASFRAIKAASQLIDMRVQKGEHPRMGATDVCPLIPVSNITMDEVADWSRKLAKRVGEELQIPVYLYENSQPDKTRSNLSIIRAGEYEGFFNKIKQFNWAPDFGPAELNARSGATVIGARDFLVAYNVNLDTALVNEANAIAYAVRESGRGGVPGALKSVKAIGWYIPEYGKAQVSTNLTNINSTPVHVAFEEVRKQADLRGIKVTGSELIGLIPLKCMLEAGKYFLGDDKAGEDELVNAAVKGLGLNELAPFEPQERIIEYLLQGKASI